MKASITKYLQCSSHATDFHAELSVMTDHFELFRIMIKLSGYSNLGYVIKCVFELLENLKQCHHKHVFIKFWKNL